MFATIVAAWIAMIGTGMAGMFIVERDIRR